MNNSIVVCTRYKNLILCIHELGGRVEDLHFYSDEELQIKNIYRGKVKNIIKNIGAAFVEVAPSLVCYMPLNDLDKFIILNRNRTENDLRVGDELPVQIVKGAVKNKAPMCSGILRIKNKEREELINKAKTRSCFSVLYSAKPEFLSFFNLIDISGIDKITCVDDDIFQNIDGYFSDYKSDAIDKKILDNIRANISIYNDDYPLNKLYKIDSLIMELTSRQVWLKSGANIVIDYTEAMTIIDVNTSKSIRAKEDNHILSVNIEAFLEAVRQIKLRNLSGMILIDFINDSEDNTNALIDEINNVLSNSNSKLDFVDITALGIGEFVRAKKTKPIYELI